MRRGLPILLLLATLAGFILYRVITSQPTIPAGDAAMQMAVGDFTVGTATLHNVKIDAQFSPHFSEYPKDWAALLRQKLHSLEIETIHLPYDSGAVNLNGFTVKFAPKKEAGKWQGEWKLSGLALESSYPLPPLTGAGTLVADADKITWVGKIQDEKAAYVMAFSGRYELARPDDAFVQFTSGQLPFEGGVVKLEEGKLALKGKDRFSGLFQAENIQLVSLLAHLLEGKVTASGTVSGKVPLTIRDNGTPIIGQAMLSAGGGGVISLQPGALPAGNEQLALVSNVLANFHYTALSISLSSNEKEELAATLAIAGSNPDLYNGRPIKLNVHLTGDLLSLIRQSVLPINDPKTLFEKGKHEKP